jgi:hypothetical protein
MAIAAPRRVKALLKIGVSSVWLKRTEDREITGPRSAALGERAMIGGAQIALEPDDA